MGILSQPQKSRLPLLSFLTLLAFLFSVALTFATVEAPRIIDLILADYFPDYIPADPVAVELVGIARPIGYACIAAIIVLIVVGFVTKRKNLSFLGVLFFFLPTFGYFASSMFLLAGLGILRASWIPFLDPSVSLVKLGDIAYLPYMIIVYPFSLLGLDIRRHLALVAMGLGFLMFFLGTVAWFYGKVERRKTVTFWIYRYSRHPQYLGFIVWSYGVMLQAAQTPVPWGGENPGASLPWLISTLVVVCIALAEEITMMKKDRDMYLEYKNSAPFMFPIPKSVTSAITAPVRILMGKNQPEDRREIVMTFAVYFALFIMLSLPFFLLNWPPGPGWWSLWPFNHPPLPLW